MPFHGYGGIFGAGGLKAAGAPGAADRVQSGRDPALVEAEQSNDHRSPSSAGSISLPSWTSAMMEKIFETSRRSREIGGQHGAPRMQHHVDVAREGGETQTDRLAHAPLDAVPLDRLAQNAACCQTDARAPPD